MWWEFLCMSKGNKIFVIWQKVCIFSLEFTYDKSGSSRQKHVHYCAAIIQALNTWYQAYKWDKILWISCRRSLSVILTVTRLSSNWHTPIERCQSAWWRAILYWEIMRQKTQHLLHLSNKFLATKKKRKHLVKINFSLFLQCKISEIL